MTILKCLGPPLIVQTEGEIPCVERNYHLVRLELLAFVFACGKFRYWLAEYDFKVEWISRGP